MALLEVTGISKNFGSTHVLQNISLNLEKGEALAIIGSSGSGKTTLLRCLNFLETPDTGVIRVDGKTLWDAADPATHRESEVRKKRLHFGLVFQNFNLFPQYTALQNITLAGELLAKEKPEYKANRKAIHAELEEKARALLAQMGLSERENHYPHQLSGGQQQRVAIARALALEPDILCFDEPTSALDPELTGEVLRVLRDLADQKTTMIIVTHEMSFARDVADRILFMDGGVVAQMASPEEMLEHPATERIADFLGKHAPESKNEHLVERFMRTNVRAVKKNRGVMECAELMARYSVDTLLVKDETGHYLGTVSIGDIRKWGRDLSSIEPIVRQTARTVYVGEDARESFDYLLESSAPYVIVLNRDNTIAGIVTKTSVARSVAENLWREQR